MRLKSRINDINIDQVEYVAKRYALPQSIARLLLSRVNIDEVESFINTDINGLFSPFLIKNMKKVIQKIQFAKDGNKKILIYGDYDVDGITSTSLLYLFLKEIGVNTSYYIPPRANGYGLSTKSLNEAINKFSPDLIITVDCGITSVEEVEYIKGKGIDIIITDHHTPQSILPDTLIINPHLEDLKFKDLCGCGVAFKIIEGYFNLKKENYLKYLPIVAIGTIADVVPLKSDNRIMVQLGLSLQSMLPKGIKMLCDMLEIKQSDLNSQTIAYKLAPVLNSAGRLKNADLAVKIFVGEDEDELIRLCSEIILTNKERQQITEDILAEAESQIVKERIPSAIVLKSKDWDAGVIGIVASKIMDKYKRTTILFTENNGMLKGSCRSIEGINIFDELDKVKDYIVQFGGHEKAAGLTVDIDMFDAFREAIIKNIKESMKNVETITYYDMEISSGEIDTDFVKKLGVLEPFGECNPSPLFLLKMTSPEIEFMKNNKHISLKFHSVKVKYFYADKQITNYRHFTDSYNLVKISLSQFNGMIYPSVICDNAIFSSLSVKAKSQEELRYKAAINNLDFTLNNVCDIQKLKSDDNFIVCTYNYNNFKKLEKIFEGSVTYTSGSVMMAEKRKNICFGLENITETSNFENVYFTEKSMAKCIKADNKTLIEGFEDFSFNGVDRQKLLSCYLALDRFSKIRVIMKNEFFVIEDFDAESMHTYFESLYSNFNLTQNEFLF